MQSTDRPVVTLSGEYDLSRREEMRDDLYVLKDKDAIAVDLAEVKYMDSTSIGVLVNFNRRFIQKGGPPIKLLNLQPRVVRLLKITGLDQVFDLS